MLNQCTDAGRSLTHPTERKDCTVVALANSAGISYLEAYKFAAQVGRRFQHGMKQDAIKTMLRNVDISGVAVTRQLTVPTPARPTNYRFDGYFSHRVRRRGVSVESFIRTLPKRGRFYLACTTHAFAYVNGVVVDNLSRPLSRATMYLAYEIIPKHTHFRIIPEAKQQPAITQSQISELWERLNKLEARRRNHEYPEGHNRLVGRTAENGISATYTETY
jgi:predicted DNA-binding protein